MGGLLFAAPAQANTKIFACTADWASMATDLGGKHVDVYAATHAKQDIHHLRAKPSLIAQMRQAEFIFCNGAALEIGWLPILLKRASPNLRSGNAGYLMAADYATLKGIPSKVDRSMGDVHPDGNPHFHLDPENIRKIAKVFVKQLSEIDPQNAQDYQNNLRSFLNSFDKALNQSDATKLKGMKLVSYHTNWLYLADWLGMDIIATLEPKPGVPPTAAYLEELLQKVSGQNVSAIILAPYEDTKAAKWLSQKTGIPIITLPFSVGGNENAQDIPSLYSDTIQRLRKAQ